MAAFGLPVNAAKMKVFGKTKVLVVDSIGNGLRKGGCFVFLRKIVARRFQFHRVENIKTRAAPAWSIF